MNRADLDARNTAAVRRYARQLADSDGRPPQALLDDLAAIADEHAAEMNKAANEGLVRMTPGTGGSAGGTGAPPLVVTAGGNASTPGSAGSGHGGSTAAASSTTTGGSNTTARTQRTRTRAGGTPK